MGDSIRDLEAGRARGCSLALVRTGKGRKSETKLAEAGLDNVPVYDDLAAVVNALLKEGD